jgi:hypothetical protein
LGDAADRAVTSKEKSNESSGGAVFLVRHLIPSLREDSRLIPNRAIFADWAVHAGILALVAAVFFVGAPAVAQSTPDSSAAQMPAWQVAAGGHMEFEVASIRPAGPDAGWHSNIDFSIEDLAVPPGASSLQQPSSAG